MWHVSILHKKKLFLFFWLDFSSITDFWDVLVMLLKFCCYLTFASFTIDEEDEWMTQCAFRVCSRQEKMFNWLSFVLLLTQIVNFASKKEFNLNFSWLFCFFDKVRWILVVGCCQLWSMCQSPNIHQYLSIYIQISTSQCLIIPKTSIKNLSRVLKPK
jgi:hypothetical protein